jgi:hypothetical protein
MLWVSVFASLLFCCTATNWTASFFSSTPPFGFAVEKSTNVAVVLSETALIGFDIGSGAVVMNVSGHFAQNKLLVGNDGFVVLVSVPYGEMLALAVAVPSGTSGQLLKSGVKMALTQGTAFSTSSNRLFALGADNVLHCWSLSLSNGSFAPVFTANVPTLSHDLALDSAGDLFYLSAGFLNYTAIKVSGQTGAVIWGDAFCGCPLWWSRIDEQQILLRVWRRFH